MLNFPYNIDDMYDIINEPKDINNPNRKIKQKGSPYNQKNTSKFF